MTKQERTNKAIEILKYHYPDAQCALTYKAPYQLMIAVILSAQCTDARVNLVTPGLFQQFPSMQAFADADLSELEQAIKTCGFYHNKAKNIKKACQRLLTVYHGILPDTMQELLTLPGVGRKTANLLLGDVYHQPAVVTDTHFIRITGRLGLTQETEPKKVETDLRALLPPEESSDFCHRIVLFGRETCQARKPKCHACPMADFCPSQSVFLEKS